MSRLMPPAMTPQAWTNESGIMSDTYEATVGVAEGPRPVNSAGEGLVPAASRSAGMLATLGQVTQGEAVEGQGTGCETIVRCG